MSVRDCIFLPFTLIARLFGRNSAKKITHEPKQFKQYMDSASACIKSVMGDGEGKIKRSTRWHLIHGRRINSFGEPDWVWKFQGEDVLGVAVGSNPIEIKLGTPDGVKYNRHTAKHEAGHGVRMPHGDYGHNPALRKCFQGWSDTGRRVPRDVDLIAVVIDYPDHSSTLKLCTAQSLRREGFMVG